MGRQDLLDWNVPGIRNPPLPLLTKPLPLYRPHEGPPGLKISTMLLLQAGFYAFGFLSVAMGSTLYYQGKYEYGASSNDGGIGEAVSTGGGRDRRYEEESFSVVALNGSFHLFHQASVTWGHAAIP